MLPVTFSHGEGDNKPAELKFAVGIAKPGDIVLAHDDAPNLQAFKAKICGKRWNWCEITDTDLAASGIRAIDSPKLCEAMWFGGVVQSIPLQSVTSIAAIIEATGVSKRLGLATYSKTPTTDRDQQILRIGGGTLGR